MYSKQRRKFDFFLFNCTLNLSLLKAPLPNWLLLLNSLRFNRNTHHPVWGPWRAPFFTCLTSFQRIWTGCFLYLFLIFYYLQFMITILFFITLIFNHKSTHRLFFFKFQIYRQSWNHLTTILILVPLPAPCRLSYELLQDLWYNFRLLSYF